MTEVRISRITLSNFRGAPGVTTLDFSANGAEKAVSCLILGDNGTGKSSFIDGIEFALQARIHPYFGMQEHVKLAKLRNLKGAADADCFAEVLLTSGKTIRRSVAWNASKTRIVKQPHIAGVEFGGANFTLRREDIVSFLRMQADQRPFLFSAFLRKMAVHAGPKPEERDEESLLRERLRPLQESRDEVRVKIAEALGEPLDGVPSNSPHLDSYYVERGLIKNAIERRSEGVSEEQRYLFDLRRDFRAIVAQITRIQQDLKEWDRHVQVRQITELLSALNVSVNKNFHKISPAASFIDAIDISFGPKGKSLIFNARLGDGSTALVEDYLSEANLDLLALLLFLGLLKEAADRGQPKILVLDDVLQSVDSVLRVSVAEFLLEEFASWQIIMTFHDRLWLEQFRALCMQKGHSIALRTLTSWNFEAGPCVVDYGGDASFDLRNVIGSSSPPLLASQAGLLLETMSDWLSKSLGTSVKRKAGDRYTLADTWPGVVKALKKTQLASLTSQVNRYSMLRNLAGAHYNEFAQTLTLAEAQEFARSVLAMWDSVWCNACRTTIQGTVAPYQCKCTSISAG